MGCQSSRNPYEKIYSTCAHINRYQREYESLRLSESEIGIFYECYMSLLQGTHSQLALEDLFFGSLHSQKLVTPLLAKMYHVRCARDVNIDFHTFVIVTWDLCSLPDRFLNQFVFETLDTASNGVLLDFNAFEFLKEVFGRRFEEFGKPHANALFDHTKETFEISAKGFVAYSQQNPEILGPVYDAVYFLRGRVISELYWKSVCNERVKLFGNCYVPSKVMITFGGDLEVILKDQKIHRVDELLNGETGRADQRGGPPVVKQKKSIVANLFRSGSNILRQQSRDLAKLAAVKKRKHDKKHKKKNYLPELRKKGQKFSVHVDSSKVHPQTNPMAVANEEER